MSRLQWLTTARRSEIEFDVIVLVKKTEFIALQTDVAAAVFKNGDIVPVVFIYISPVVVSFCPLTAEKS